MTEELNILQYNVMKSGNRVMTLLLADPRVLQFSLLALEEPFDNFFNNSLTTLLTHLSIYFTHVLKILEFVLTLIGLSIPVLSPIIFQDLITVICSLEALLKKLEKL